MYFTVLAPPNFSLIIFSIPNFKYLALKKVKYTLIALPLRIKRGSVLRLLFS